MRTESVSLFVVPIEHIDELREFARRWNSALRHRRDDIEVIMNKLYTRAAQIALYEQTAVGEYTRSPMRQVAGYLFAKLVDTSDRDVLAPNACRALKQAIKALEIRLGGERALLYQVSRRMRPGTEPASLRPAYRTLRATLDRAIEQRAGFVWLWYLDDADAVLAQRRAERVGAIQPGPKPERTNSVQYDCVESGDVFAEDCTAQASRASVALPVENPDGDNGTTSIELYAVPVDRLPALHALLEEDDRLWDEHGAQASEQSLDVIARFYSLAWDEAPVELCLTTFGHRSAFDVLERELTAFAPTAIMATGLYALEQVRQLARALDAYIVHRGGLGAANATITAQAYGHSRPHTDHVLTSVRRLLAQTIEREHGLARFTQYLR